MQLSDLSPSSGLEAARDALLLATAAHLPFESAAASWALGPLVLTSFEVVLLACVAAHAAVGLRSRGWRALSPWPTLVLLLAAVPACGLIAAALSESYVGVGTRAALRLFAVVTLYAVATAASSREKVAQRIRDTIAVVAVAVAVIGLVEVSPFADVVEPWLQSYRPKASIAHGSRRLTATFSHANLTAAFVAASLPMMATFRARSDRSINLVGGAFVVVGAVALAYTQSRGGLVAGAVALAVFAVVRGRWSAGLPLAALLVGCVAVVSLDTTVAGRWGLAGSSYDVEMEVPKAITAQPSATIRLRVRAINRGYVPWRSAGSDVVAVAPTWVNLDEGRVVTIGATAGARADIPLPYDVVRGAKMEIEVVLSAPKRPGNYAISWDLHHVGYAYFSALGVPLVFTMVQVGVPPASAVAGLATRGPAQQLDVAAIVRRDQRASSPEHANEPTRPQLWQQAWAMTQERPLFGWGLNTFRLRKAALMPALRHDDRVHSNNLYLEIAVGAGLLGLLALVVWLVAVLRIALKNRRQPVVAAGLASLAAVLAHGVVDAPFFFYSTSVLLVLAAALSVSAAHRTQTVISSAGVHTE